MPVYKYVKEVTSKKTGKKIKKNAYRCIGSYIDAFGQSQKFHKRGFETEAEAKEWERKFLLEATSLTGSSNATFNDLFNMFIEHKQKTLKERTFRDLKIKCEKNILPFWSKFKIKDIKLQHVIKFQNELLDATYEKHTKVDGKIVVENVLYSNETMETIQTRLKAIFKYGVNLGMINNLQLISFETVKRTDEQKKEMLFWHPEEYNQFIDIVDDPSFEAMYNILYWCGLRIGEVLALSWNDVDLFAKTIKVSKTYNNHHHVLTTPKTQQSYRTVIMPNKCYSSIKRLRAIQSEYEGFSEDSFLFGFDKPFDDNKVHRYTDKWIQQANVKKIRIHDFRHSHVSLLINLGCSAFDIAKRMGHSVDMVNNRYGHWFNDAQQKMVDKLNSI